MTKVTISVKMILPAVEFGTLTYEATWEDDVDAAQVDRSALIIETAKRLHNDLAMAALSLVNAEVDYYAPLMVKPNVTTPDYEMRKTSKIYRAFRILNPDVIIPAMTALMEAKAEPSHVAHTK